MAVRFLQNLTGRSVQGANQMADGQGCQFSLVTRRVPRHGTLRPKCTSLDSRQCFNKQSTLCTMLLFLQLHQYWQTGATDPMIRVCCSVTTINMLKIQRNADMSVIEDGSGQLVDHVRLSMSSNARQDWRKLLQGPPLWLVRVAGLSPAAAV